MPERKRGAQPPDENDLKFGDELPVLPIRNAVLFPGAVAPFDVGREKSVALVEDLENLSQPVIAIFAQRDPNIDDPGEGDLYPVGAAARVLKSLKHSTGNYSLILQGLTRIQLAGVTQHAPYLRAKIKRLEETPVADDVEAEALAMSLRDVAKQVIQLMPELPREAQSLIDSIQEPGSLADLVAANLDAPVDEKSQLMSTLDVKDRIRQVLKLLTRQLEILKMRERINSQIKEEMGKNQREYVLRQQLKAIKEELGEDEGDQGDLDGLEERIAKANLPTTPSRWRASSSGGCGRCRWARRSTPWCAPTSTGSSTCRGRSRPRQPRRSPRCARCSTRTTTASRRSRSASSSTSPSASSSRQEGPHPLPARAPRRGQDLPRAQHRQGARAQVRAHLARRRARRGGDPRPPAHLRGRAARAQVVQGMKKAGCHQPGVHARRGRQDRPRLPRRPRGGPARGARPRAEQHLQRPLPGDPLRPVAGDVHRHGQRGPTRSRRRSATAWRSSRSRATRATRRRPSRGSTCCPSSSTSTASRRRSSRSPTPPSRRSSRHYTREAGVRSLERQVAAVSAAWR
jgi:Lon protease-like protein